MQKQKTLLACKHLPHSRCALRRGRIPPDDGDDDDDDDGDGDDVSGDDDDIYD